jgi:N-acetylmuramoyl-L-alanine amidase
MSADGPSGSPSPAPRSRFPGRRHAIAGGLLAAILVPSLLYLALMSSGRSSSNQLPEGRRPPTPTMGAVTPLDRTGFASGACLALPPTSGDRHRSVFLDAGHGGPDPGASGTTTAGRHVEEKVVTLSVALDTAAQLRAEGYRVVLDRTADTSVARLTSADHTGAALSTTGSHADLLARVRCADLSTAAALVSIHFNAFGDRAVRGATTLFDASRPFSAANRRLATLLQRNILAASAGAGRQVPDRGIAEDTTGGGGLITARGNAYGHLVLLGPAQTGYVDHPSTMPGALVEPLFLTSPADADLATTPADQRAIATGITHAVQQFLTTP